MATAAQRTRSRKPAPAPEDVQVECITAPQYGGGRKGLVYLNGTAYLLVCHGATSRDGYRLWKVSDPACCYDIDTSSGHPRCDCPDFEHRCNAAGRPYCKHGHALIQLRKQGHI